MSSFLLLIFDDLQKIRANLLTADKRFRKLIFSVKPKEKEELLEKKRNLMVNTSVTITILELAWGMCC